MRIVRGIWRRMIVAASVASLPLAVCAMFAIVARQLTELRAGQVQIAEQRSEYLEQIAELRARADAARRVESVMAERIDGIGEALDRLDAAISQLEERVERESGQRDDGSDG